MSSLPTPMSDMSVLDWQAYLVERAAMTLAHFVASTESERLNWKPSLDGKVHTRSVFEQVQECVGVNRRFAALLRGDSPAGAPEISIEDSQTAQSMLIESAQELGAAIRGLGPDALEQEFETKMGPLTGAILLELPLANMQYHSGQVNMIQLLYGDEEFHVPPKFM